MYRPSPSQLSADSTALAGEASVTRTVSGAVAVFPFELTSSPVNTYVPLGSPRAGQRNAPTEASA